MQHSLDHAPLGKTSAYVDTYAPELLFPVPRQDKRDELGITGQLPFVGVDIWNAWEVSWLNSKGKPQVAVAEIRIPATSTHIIESKSFKLYLNSLNQTHFDGWPQVVKVLEKDLSACADGVVHVVLSPLDRIPAYGKVVDATEVCIDDLDIAVDTYMTDAQLLKADAEGYVEEQVISHLLKSNCPVTGQPDWGSVSIHYAGRPIQHDSLLRYIISFRQHTEFHEQCVERIFTDVQALIAPEKLTVSARYVRRGGLDINPYRSTENSVFDNVRLLRQ
jgi:7-cyano-7-deazaguanine reductase